MLAAARKWISNGRTGFLTIHGDYGNGKTTFLMALVNDCIDHGVDAQYITMTEVMAYAKEAFDSKQAGDSDLGRIIHLAKKQVLAIDEVEKARQTDYTFEIQTYLFNVRYRLAHQYGTILAWNGAFESINMGSVQSRLSEFDVIENKDTDMRPLLRKAGKARDE